jgi:hypothetical protein
MKTKTRNGLLVGAGFLAGTLGIKALTSATAKRGYVHIAAQGIRAKNAYLDVVEQAKAEVDDIVSEASYLATEKPADGEAAAPAAE